MDCDFYDSYSIDLYIYPNSQLDRLARQISYSVSKQRFQRRERSVYSKYKTLPNKYIEQSITSTRNIAKETTIEQGNIKQGNIENSNIEKRDNKKQNNTDYDYISFLIDRYTHLRSLDCRALTYYTRQLKKKILCESTKFYSNKKNLSK